MQSQPGGDTMRKTFVTLMVLALLVGACSRAEEEPVEAPAAVAPADAVPEGKADEEPLKEPYLQKVRAGLARFRQVREEEDGFIEDLNRDWLESDPDYRQDKIEEYQALGDEMASIRDEIQDILYSDMPEALRKFHDKVCEALEAELAARDEILAGLVDPDKWNDPEFIKRIEKLLHVAEDAWENANEELDRAYPGERIEPPSRPQIPFGLSSK